MKVIEIFINTEDRVGNTVQKVIDYPTREEIKYARNDINNWGMVKGSISLVVEQRNRPVYWRLVDKYTTVLPNGKEVKVEKRGDRYYYRNQLGRMIPVSKSAVTEKVDYEQLLIFKS